MKKSPPSLSGEKSSLFRSTSASAPPISVHQCPQREHTYPSRLRGSVKDFLPGTGLTLDLFNIETYRKGPAFFLPMEKKTATAIKVGGVWIRRHHNAASRRTGPRAINEPMAFLFFHPCKEFSESRHIKLSLLKERRV